jgi:hypothetical protein
LLLASRTNCGAFAITQPIEVTELMAPGVATIATVSQAERHKLKLEEPATCELTV